MEKIAYCPPVAVSDKARAAESPAMYRAHWGLSRDAFPSGITRDRFFVAGAQTEALARLRYVVEGRRRFALLVGEHGSGKSALLDAFARERRQFATRTALFSAAGLTAADLYWQFAAAVAIGPQTLHSPARLFQKLADFAMTARLQRAHVLLLLDDMDQAGPDFVTQLARLANTEAATPWLTVVLATTPAASDRLGGALLDAVEMRVEVEPWDQAETVCYVQHALVAAGRDEPVFTEEALASLFALSDGYPRRVNRIAERALIISALEAAQVIEPHLVEEAACGLAVSA